MTTAIWGSILGVTTWLLCVSAWRHGRSRRILIDMLLAWIDPLALLMTGKPFKRVNATQPVDNGPSRRRSPASRLGALARFIWTKKTYDRVFAPVLADAHQEWSAADFAGHIRQVRWIQLRTALIMVSHMLAQIPVSILRLVWRIVF